LCEYQIAVALIINGELTIDDELAKKPAPGLRAQLAANAIDGQTVMSVALNARVRCAEEHVDEITDTVALAGSIDGRKGFLSCDCPIDHVRRAEAVVA